MRTQSLKRFASWSLSIVLCTSLLLVSLTSNTAQAAETEKETIITLLGTSDIHGRFMPWDYALDGPNPAGSMTQLYTMVKKVRAENPNTILLDAGDMIQDNSAELFNDQPQSPMMVAMNEMNYDAWVMGNHEFNFGLDVLEKISSQFKGQALVGNIFKENGDRYMPAYTIIERDGIKVGVIGMNTPMITEFEKGTDHLDGVIVKDPVEETRKAIAELNGRVDVMVGLMHMGLDNENGKPGTGVTDIANANPELAAIFAGHMHQLIESQTVNGVLISEPNKYGTHLSRIDLTFAKEDGKVVLKSKEAKALAVKKADGTYEVSDPSLEKTLHPFHEFARADANIEVAELKGTNMVPADEIQGIPAVQIQETPLSDFFTEVMLHYSDADVVAHQIDNDKAKLDVGPIKKKDIAFNYQYTFGEVTVYEVTGRDLKDYMEWAAGYFNSSRPGDITISFDPKRRASKYSTNDFFGGVTYEIDLTKPYGSRITNLQYSNGKVVQTNDTLKLGMNAYRMEALIAKGGPLEGRKFEQLWSSKDASAFGEIQGTIRNLSIAYLKDVMKGVYEPKIQHNWKITGVDLTAPERADVVELIKAGILTVPASEDGKYTNVASINILDAVTADEIEVLSSKVGVDPAQFKSVKSKGAFYQQLNKARKALSDKDSKGSKDGKDGKDDAATTAPDKPITPSTPKPAPTPTPETAKPDTTKPSKPEDKTSGKQVKVTATYLNVRAGASSKAKVITSVPQGTMLEVISTDRAYGWVKIKLNGRTAFVYGKYVSMMK
ncbi:MAG: 5'-nucleotidase C-terminal domain-containing protein [Paenibacillus sp.]|uniref:5'-nucleotidase C-terminal domain-containing protein n=1 Tax=Paenibacillus sp. TaxID=58172 RepID=UPI0025E77102|nr:5'-nucleotidase C-terminal domain-containing protein [Paenibacillus sp.]MBR2565239.1 5'-nucleotidase C-terminal domain-containing protein [Paenibacillus sp.]